MSIIDNIRITFGNYFLKKEIKKIDRSRQIKNLTDTRSIGILFDASDESEHNIVTEFVKHFQDMQKSVKALGFVNYNRIPHYCFPKLSYDYITKRELNWYLKPTGSKVIDFINEPFDLMIDISAKENFPLRYIAALSKCGFKVGRFDEKHKEYYDFMLNVDSDILLKDFFRELIHYLSIINNGQETQPL